MKNRNETGFSLIELLIVIVIIGILAAISIPSLIKSRIVAENRAAVGVLSTMRSAQLAFYGQNQQYASLARLNDAQKGGLGVADPQNPENLRRGSYVYSMTTSDNLKNTYFIVATRDNDTPFTYRYTVDQSGTIDRIE